jgi:DNA polymerase-4/DNA polymerase IV (DinB-like DNA polymerase)
MIVDLAAGIDERKVVPYRPEDAKSISREMTFQEDVSDYEFLKHVLLLLSVSVERRAKRSGLHGGGVSLKLTYSDMKSITRSRILPYVDDAVTIYREAVRLLNQVQHRPVRLVGVGIYNLSKEVYQQLVLEGFREESSSSPRDELHKELLKLREIYHLDYSGHLDEIYKGETLYRTVEYMRKKKKRSPQ